MTREVNEAQRGDALAGFHRGLLEAVARVLGEDAMTAEPLDFEHLAIDAVAEVA